MAHLVRYSSPEGEERHEDVADLDAAVERVEQLRNDEGVSDVRLYREVPLEFKTYVRVAVAGDGPSRSDGSSASAAAPSGAAVLSPPPASAAAAHDAQARADVSDPQTDAEARATENRRTSLFNRGQAS